MFSFLFRRNVDDPLQIKAACCLPFLTCSASGREAQGLLSAAARSFPENETKSELLKGQLQSTARFVQSKCEYFYSLVVSLS